MSEPPDDDHAEAPRFPAPTRHEDPGPYRAMPATAPAPPPPRRKTVATLAEPPAPPKPPRPDSEVRRELALADFEAAKTPREPARGGGGLLGPGSLGGPRVFGSLRVIAVVVILIRLVMLLFRMRAHGP